MKLTLKNRLLLATGLVVLSLASSHLFTLTLLGDGLMIIASLVAAWPIAIKALAALRHRIVGIDLLVTIAVIGAIIIGEYWESAAVASLFLLGEYLEARALEKTRSAIKLLLDMSPQTARVIRHGQEVEVAPRDVKFGETVIVRPGEKIAVDGTVLDGEAYVDQSSITGESMPVSLSTGSTSYSGTVIESGYLEIKAEKIGPDTMFARILHLVEEAQDSKARSQAFLERFAKYYTPAIMVLSVVIFMLTADIYLALTLLVIACPGALVIAVPVSIVAGIGNAAQRGVLIKGGEAIEQAAKTDQVAFDKTGTLTVGRPKVVDSLAMVGSQAELLQIAASAELFSEHPLARAIITAADASSSGSLTKPTKSDIIIGQGVVARVDRSTVLVGNSKLLAAHDIDLPSRLTDYLTKRQSDGNTVVLIARDNKAIGAISITDTIRDGARNTIAELRRRGIRTVMLTGDNQLAAAAIAQQLGIDDYHADLSPEDKVRLVRQLKADHPNIVMVGDGVNDAPALATASLGIAVGGPGKDVAMETADIVLLSGDISRLDYALGLSRATVANMKQNIYFAVITVVLLLIGVLTNIVFLSSGMLIHVISVLLVILNALRLMRYNR